VIGGWNPVTPVIQYGNFINAVTLKQDPLSYLRSQTNIGFAGQTCFSELRLNYLLDNRTGTPTIMTYPVDDQSQWERIRDRMYEVLWIGTASTYGLAFIALVVLWQNGGWSKTKKRRYAVYVIFVRAAGMLIVGLIAMGFLISPPSNGDVQSHLGTDWPVSMLAFGGQTFCVMALGAILFLTSVTFNMEEVKQEAWQAETARKLMFAFVIFMLAYFVSVASPGHQDSVETLHYLAALFLFFVGVIAIAEVVYKAVLRRASQIAASEQNERKRKRAERNERSAKNVEKSLKC